MEEVCRAHNKPMIQLVRSVRHFAATVAFSVRLSGCAPSPCGYEKPGRNPPRMWTGLQATFALIGSAFDVRV